MLSKRIYFKSQSIGCSPLLLSISFTCEKCLHQKNHLCTLNGDGCGHSNMICLLVSISSFFFCANAHHKRKITQSFLSEIVLITASVNVCQPISLCELGVSFITVRLAFNKKTHCSARWERFHFVGIDIHISAFNSLKIFLSEGGNFTPSWTEKHNPWASHSPW